MEAFRLTFVKEEMKLIRKAVADLAALLGEACAGGGPVRRLTGECYGAAQRERIA